MRLQGLEFNGKVILAQHQEAVERLCLLRGDNRSLIREV